MVDSIAEKLAHSMKRIAPEETASVEIMKYGLIVLFNGATVIVLSLAIASITGRIDETVTTLISFGLLRIFAGGFHFQSSLNCILFSTLLMTMLPLIPINNNWTWILTSISMILLFIYAPSNIQNQTRILSKYYPFLKLFSVLIVATNLTFYSSTLAKSFFTLSLLTVKLRREKGEKGT